MLRDSNSDLGTESPLGQKQKQNTEDPRKKEPQEAHNATATAISIQTQ